MARFNVTGFWVVHKITIFHNLLSQWHFPLSPYFTITTSLTVCSTTQNNTSAVTGSQRLMFGSWYFGMACSILHIIDSHLHSSQWRRHLFVGHAYWCTFYCTNNSLAHHIHEWLTRLLCRLYHYVQASKSYWWAESEYTSCIISISAEYQDQHSQTCKKV